MAVMRLAACVAVAGLVACAGVRPSAVEYDYFGPARPGDDPWYEVVESWQARARSEGVAPALSATELATAGVRAGEVSPLAGAMRGFVREQRHELAQRVATWAQARALAHYKEEEGATGPENDHWLTVGELLAADGDDCDGLDLVALDLMRRLGFPREELFRAIVRRDEDRSNHMVTLWFEDANDPWVIDATGAMTFRVIRFSRAAGWTPTKVFDETRHFTVLERRSLVPAFAGR
jgi:hypothetical protein